MSKDANSPSLSPKAVQGLKKLQDNWSDFFDCLYQIEDYIWNARRRTKEISDSETLKALEKLKELDEMISPLEL